MIDLLHDAVRGGAAITAAWLVLSVPAAMLVGRVVRARELHDRR